MFETINTKVFAVSTYNYNTLPGFFLRIRRGAHVLYNLQQPPAPIFSLTSMEVDKVLTKYKDAPELLSLYTVAEPEVSSPKSIGVQALYHLRI